MPSLSSLDPARWSRFSALLEEVLCLETQQQSAWLAALPDADADLLAHLQGALLIHHSIESSPSQGRPQLPASEQDDPFVFQPGMQIGQYRLSHPLGRGGMGEVWLARRSDGSLNRDVALKLPHTWLLSIAQRRRLTRERDVLASLTHPNIAQLYDAGLSEDGQPWLALEFVEGEPLDVYCRQRSLSLSARLDLFTQVLEAVEAAHARLIVHRDLKPANILVAAQGQVKLLDFGIAKLLDPAQQDETQTQLTQLTGRAATFVYAAPEQLSDGLITVATDIYSLGVVLFELISGRRPFSGSRQQDSAGLQARESPPLPSSSASDTAAAQTGGLRPAALSRALRGDLDAIVLKALAYAPAERYASVERLADDLARHRRGEPIQARHITRLERGAKFVRRHRLAMAVGTLVAGSLIGGLSISLWQQQKALIAAQRAEATRNVLIGVLSANMRSTASTRPAGSLTAREMVDDLVYRTQHELADQPDTQIELLLLACRVYQQWWDHDALDRSSELYRQAVSRRYGPLDSRIIESYLRQARDRIDGSRLDRARLSLDAAGRLLQDAGLQESALAASWLANVADLQIAPIGPSPERLRTLDRAATMFERFHPNDDFYGWTVVYLAQELVMSGRAAEALPRLARAEAIERQRKPLSRWRTGNLLAMQARANRALGHVELALQQYDRAAPELEATFGHTSDAWWEDLRWRGMLRAWQGDMDAALNLYAQGLQGYRALNDDERKGYGPAFLADYALLLDRKGQHVEAEALLREAITGGGSESSDLMHTGEIRRRLAALLSQRGRLPEAAEQLRLAQAEYEALQRPAAEPVLELSAQQANFARLRGDPLKAQALWEQVLQLAAFPMPVQAEARMGLAELAEQRGERSRARQLAQQSLQDLSRVKAAYDPLRRQLLEQRAQILVAGP